MIDALIDDIIAREGDYSDHPHDRGGPTRWGITQATARRYGYQGEMHKLPRKTARQIYRKLYWHEPGFDKVAHRSEPLAGELADSGVNLGPHLPITWLQRWLNGFNGQGELYRDITVDGVIGPQTLTALDSLLRIRGGDGMGVLRVALNASQAHRYLEITEDRGTQEDFLYGWVRARVYEQVVE